MRLKLGWWAFSMAYLGIGVVESAALQSLAGSQEPVSLLGASGVILEIVLGRAAFKGIEQLVRSGR